MRLINQECTGRVYFTHFRDYIAPLTDPDLRRRLLYRASYTPLGQTSEQDLFHLLSAELLNSLEAVRVTQELRLR